MKEYSWHRGNYTVGTRSLCWFVWWRDPKTKFYSEVIAKVDTLKEVHAAIRDHKNR